MIAALTQTAGEFQMVEAYSNFFRVCWTLIQFMLYKSFNWTGNGYRISTIKTRLKTGEENKQNKKKKYVYVHLGAAAEGSQQYRNVGKCSQKT